jgi:hypothetical protein
MRVMGQPYWRLRDYLRASGPRRQRATAHRCAGVWVQAAAAAQPTYGYRRVYQALRQQHRPIGRERVRQLMGELGLQPPPPLKKKRPAPTVVAEHDWPSGRRLQIDATRFHLDDGVAWVYLVEDVKTRQCVAISAAPTLSQERAAATLLKGHQCLMAPRASRTACDPERRRFGFYLRPLSAPLPNPRSVGALSCRSGRWDGYPGTLEPHLQARVYLSPRGQYFG